MTYFGFLLIFLVVPILIMLGVTMGYKWQGRSRPASLRSWPIWAAIVLHVFIALVYTMLWDNYLVATGVWWYDPALVTNITIWWVPIEEYTFFILQPILGGLWLLFLMRRLDLIEYPLNEALRLGTVVPLAMLWLFSILLLVSGWEPGTYLSLILVWALPPIMLQLAFGADILWRYRPLVALSIIPLTIYLSLADSLAINWGTWTIDPAQSLNVYLGGVLPFEEFLFFLVTNTLISFGIILVVSRSSHQRIAPYIERIRHRKNFVLGKGR